jgi:hypothetical protein
MKLFVVSGLLFAVVSANGKALKLAYFSKFLQLAISRTPPVETTTNNKLQTIN